MSHHSNCIVCKSEKLNSLKGYYDIHGLIYCGNCGLVFMEKIPSSADLNDYYSTYSYDTESYLSPITVKSYHLLLDEFEKYRNNNRILDVGSGRGLFLIEAKKRGWEVYGTEYSKKAVELCEDSNIQMIEGELDPSKFDVQEFDVITSFEVIEHINNPNEQLEAISTLLRKGGLFYCTTPNFNSLLRFYLKNQYNIISYPEHLSYYTKKTLNRVVKQHSLKPLKFRSTGISITRLKTSKKISDEKIIAKESSDETLRVQIEKKWYLALAKSVVNFLLTITNTGMTLKGYYLKE